MPNILENNVYFMSYVNSNGRKGSPKYSFGNGDSLKLEGDFPALALTILKLKPCYISYNFRHLASIFPVSEWGNPQQVLGDPH